MIRQTEAIEQRGNGSQWPRNADQETAGFTGGAREEEGDTSGVGHINVTMKTGTKSYRSGRGNSRDETTAGGAGAIFVTAGMCLYCVQ